MRVGCGVRQHPRNQLGASGSGRLGTTSRRWDASTAAMAEANSHPWPIDANSKFIKTGFGWFWYVLVICSYYNRITMEKHGQVKIVGAIVGKLNTKDLSRVQPAAKEIPDLLVFWRGISLVRLRLLEINGPLLGVSL